MLQLINYDCYYEILKIIKGAKLQDLQLVNRDFRKAAKIEEQKRNVIILENIEIKYLQNEIKIDFFPTTQTTGNTSYSLNVCKYYASKSDAGVSNITTEKLEKEYWKINKSQKVCRLITKVSNWKIRAKKTKIFLDCEINYNNHNRTFVFIHFLQIIKEFWTKGIIELTDMKAVSPYLLEEFCVGLSDWIIQHMHNSQHLIINAILVNLDTIFNYIYSNNKLVEMNNMPSFDVDGLTNVLKEV